MKNKYALTLSLIAMVILLNTDFTFAQAGTPDSSFSGDGKITTVTNGNTHFSYGESVAIQTNGKIVVAGYETYTSRTSVLDRFVVVQYTSSGIPDKTFGGDDGIVSTGFTYSAQGRSVAIQNWDQKIVVAGSTNGKFAIARFTPAGILDNTFGGGDGIVVTSFPDSAQGQAVAINQLDHSIVVAGSSNGNFVVARYTSTGILDKTFSTDGKTTIDFGDTEAGTTDECYAVAVQSDGKIVLAGSSGNYFAVARLNINGTPDITFGGGSNSTTSKSSFKEVDGRVITPFGFTAKAYAVAIQSNGKLVVAGNSRLLNFSSYDFAVIRYNANGSPDSTFSGDGKVTTDFASGYQDHGASVAIDRSGKIIVAGYLRSSDGSIADFAIERYTSTGILDNTFSGDGKVTTDFGFKTPDYGRALAIQSDGKIVVAGTTLPVNSNYNRIAVARYHASSVRPFLRDDFNELSAINKNDAGALSNIRIYPNPVENFLNVQGLHPSAVTAISITGALGVIQKVVTSASSYTFNLKILPAGIYYVSIVANGKTTNLKFIKQ